MIPFRKMHGLGNDFVVIDARERALTLSDDQVRHIADRRRGVGCDQLVLLRPSDKADVFMEIRNADGSRVSACGNATRCVAWWIIKERQEAPDKRSLWPNDVAPCTIETDAGILHADWIDWMNQVGVDMGPPHTRWQNIPLAKPCETSRLPITLEMLHEPVAVSMGNPHMVFFVDDVGAIPLERLGPLLEHHPLFPERANVSVAQVDSPDHITLRVWERGTGLTDACGTAACAVMVAADIRGLGNKDVIVQQPGGDLRVYYHNGSVNMVGPVAESFRGEVDV